MKHQGSCHCGQVRFEAEGDFDSAVECNCSHCSRKGYLLAFVPRTQFTLHTDMAGLGTYTFNKHAIQHHFCTRCGCAPFAFGMAQGKEMASINLRCLEGFELDRIKRLPFDGRAL